MALTIKNPEAAAHRMTSSISRQVHDAAAHERAREILSARVRQCEVRYDLPSSEIHRAIDAGELEETYEVCRWIMDYQLLVRAGEA